MYMYMHKPNCLKISWSILSLFFNKYAIGALLLKYTTLYKPAIKSCIFHDTSLVY
jgi:hypothetical protein